MVGMSRGSTAPTAPDGLPVPPWVTAEVGRDGISRTDSVLRHGFSEDAIKPEWWRRRLTEVALLPAGDPGITFPSRRADGTPVLSRGDLFALADRLDDDATDDEWLRFLWHVLAWGSGTARRNNGARIAAFADPERRTERVAMLREAAGHVWNDDPASAYRALILPGRARIPALGPAFFTKVLYFLGRGVPQTEGRVGCLILDARVAASLHDAGWASLPKGNRNWYTNTYTSYCELVCGWASEMPGRPDGTRVTSDEIERILFDGPRSEAT